MSFMPNQCSFLCTREVVQELLQNTNQRTNGHVNANLISGPIVSTQTNKIGQPRVIIYINFVELDSPMLHAKFQDRRASVSGEERFFKGFYHIWAWRPFI